MAQLSSPGVSVSVIDESFYTPSAAGTVPLIVVATAQDKATGSATGTAPGTLQANAGKVYLMTSQKDLSDTFGTPVFKTDANNNPIHAGEQNEFGLQAAYSYLGVSNRAYVVRADVNLNQLAPTATEPKGKPADGTYWLDTANTAWGLFEWNSSPANITGGQTFGVKFPLVITELASAPLVGNEYTPLAGLGSTGDYAVVAVTDLIKFWYKKPTTSTSAGWVLVGSREWIASHPTVQSSTSTTTIEVGDVLTINGVNLTGVTSLDGLVSDINGGGPDGQLGSQTYTTNAITTVGSPVLHFASVAPLPPVGAVVTGTNIPADSVVVSSTSTSITINNNIQTQVSSATAITVNSSADDGAFAVLGVRAHNNAGKLELYSDGTSKSGGNGSSTDGKIAVSGTMLAALNITAGTYACPSLAIQSHTSVPMWKITGTNQENRPTGSVWIKTTTPNAGANWKVKKYSELSGAFVEQVAPIYASLLSPNAPHAEALLKLDKTGGGINLAKGTTYVQFNTALSALNSADFKIFARSAVGATTTKTSVTFPNVSNSFELTETLVNGTTYTGTVTGFTSAQTLRDLIGLAGFTNVTATIDTTGAVIISHKQGGDMYFNNLVGIDTDFFTTNFYADSSSSGLVSLWQPISEYNTAYTQSATAPTSVTANGQLWYNSVNSEVDIMVNSGTAWVGYRNWIEDKVLGAENTSRVGYAPIVSATRPSTSGKLQGDLWINTADSENYPALYKFNLDSQKWVAVNTADQTTEDGIVFADARWGTSGAATTAGSIVELLTNDFVDFDAPNPALYPTGTMLWNLRRSGFNVKKFVQDYVVTTDNNPWFNNKESMSGYYPHRWVSVAANNEDGSGAFGRKAQRKVVVQALQALVNSNQEIRDTESRIFNLIATPGYPELVGEMVGLNADRGLTSFVVADTPARLTPDATSLNNWGTNQKGAMEDSDNGLVTSDEYLGFFYPWGYTSDNVGNNIVVPPSHMILRTIALNDQVAYPWFAPAGTRRGGITNATAVGYVTAGGEFQSVALNNGQRDTLAAIKVNPITFIAGTGLVNFGQYTRAKNASALDRINVARLVIYLRRQFAQLAKPYVFEPNDKITRDEIKNAANSLLLELVGQRALYDFLVVCDESNNTPARIDKNELYLDVAIEPVKAVEFIYIPLRLKNTGEIKGLSA